MSPKAVLGLLGLAGTGVVSVAALELNGRAVALFLAVEVLVVVVGLAHLNTVHPYDPFGPTGFPLVYTILTLTTGTVIAVTVGFSGSFLDRNLVTPRLLLIQALFSVCLLIGMMVIPARKPLATAAIRRVRDPLLVHVGTVSLAGAAAYRGYLLLRHGPGSWNSSRGVDFTFTSQLALVSSLLPLLALLAILMGDHSRRRFVFPMPALVLLGVWAVASLAIGSRDEVLAPAIILAWSYHRRVRPLRGSVIVALTVVGFTLLGLVGVWRSQATQELSVATLVRPTASGVNTTAQTVRFVPSQSPYLHGSTYVAALRAGLPFVSVSKSEPSQMTASLRLPSTIGYSAASGLGYSPVGEAYWNFGWYGVAFLPLGFGMSLAWAQRHSRTWPSQPIHLLYPLLISRFPIELRSDFLQQFKGIFATLLVLTLLWALQRFTGSRRFQTEPLDQSSFAKS